MDTLKLKPVAHIHTDFPEKFGLPRQSLIVPELTGKIVFEEEYRSPDALRGIEGFSHLWLLWGFSESFASGKNDGFSPTVRPPRLGGNTRVGVFATRSPNRPNPLGLSVVRLVSVDSDRLTVSGIDMADGTPIYDIKPYLPHVDSVPDAKGGFSSEVYGKRLAVVFADGIREKIPQNKLAGLIGALEEDPRPQYQRDDGREYGFTYAGLEILFTVESESGTLTVKSAEKTKI